MNIRLITEEDIPKWKKLSFEHDCYIKEFNSDFTGWYTKNEQSQTYNKYIESKVRQKEVYMAVDISDNCLGVIAFSKKRNYITFFGISENANVKIIGNKLLFQAIKLLDNNKNIGTKLICSNSDWIKQYRDLLEENGFRETGMLIKNQIPFITFVKNQ